MEKWEPFLKKTLDLIGFRDYSLDIDLEHRHGRLFIHDDPGLIRENLPSLVENFNHLLQLVARKENIEAIFLDINNYRKERENLIIELVRASARKALATKEEVPLPAMNSYERRIVHMELAAHPDLTTESYGKGKARYVIIKPIGAEKKEPA